MVLTFDKLNGNFTYCKAANNSVDRYGELLSYACKSPGYTAKISSIVEYNQNGVNHIREIHNFDRISCLYFGVAFESKLFVLNSSEMLYLIQITTTIDSLDEFCTGEGLTSRGWCKGASDRLELVYNIVNEDNGPPAL